MLIQIEILLRSLKNIIVMTLISYGCWSGSLFTEVNIVILFPFILQIFGRQKLFLLTLILSHQVLYHFMFLIIRGIDIFPIQLLRRCSFLALTLASHGNFATQILVVNRTFFARLLIQVSVLLIFRY